MKKLTAPIVFIALFALSGCNGQTALKQDQTDTPSHKLANVELKTAKEINRDIVWAVNVGGGEYTGADGIKYQSDIVNAEAQAGRIESIRGAQDATIFKTYREGEVEINHPLANGLYDISLQFAEPEDIAVGSRVFNVLAESKVVLASMDVKQARDGNHHASLDRTVIGVEVSDGFHNIELQSLIGKPILNGLVVRTKHTRPHAWRLVWSDEFQIDGAPDADKWNYDVWPVGKVNTENQAYTERSQNVRVADGKLIIEAHKEKYGNAEYTSGRVHSLGKGDFLYGRAEVRAKLPAGQGSWSAIWMLPSDPFKYATTCATDADWQGSSECDAWPNSGEIDIMEHVGYDMNRVHGTVHTKDYYWVNGKQRKASIEAKNVAEAFHDYAIEWTPERIDIFFDGTRYFSYLKESDRWQSWPFDHPYHIILNLAIGGDWGRAGGPIDDSIFPAKMEVDYVRVYEPTSSPVGQ